MINKKVFLIIYICFIIKEYLLILTGLILISVAVQNLDVDKLFKDAPKRGKSS